MKKVLLLIISVALVFSLSACASVQKGTEFMLDTVCEITVYDGEKEYIDEAFDRCRELENVLSRTVEGSEISKLNKNGTSVVSDTVSSLIERALGYCETSEGKFDITVCAVSKLWDFNSDALPDSGKIKAALGKVDYKRVKVDGNTVSTGGTEIDLGAIAKGFICDEAVKSLKGNGVTEAIINLGGNVAVIGDNGGDGYSVGIAKPFSDGVIASLNLSDTTVSTSGIYQRYIKKDGKIYHHILDVKTGYAADTDLFSVSVICDESERADALSTVCMLLGKDKAQSLINSLDGVEAVFIDTDCNVHVSNGIIFENGQYKTVK